MSFDIGFTGDVEIDPATGSAARRGEIVVGRLRETFFSILSFWNEDQYERHWHEAVSRTVTTGKDSCLITSIANPDASEMLFWWPVYRERERVYVQNGILFYSELSAGFDPARPWAVVPSRTMINEDGQRVSEWDTEVEHLAAFAARAARRSPNP